MSSESLEMWAANEALSFGRASTEDGAKMCVQLVVRMESMVETESVSNALRNLMAVLYRLDDMLKLVGLIESCRYVASPIK